jgi:hypothetical protein
MIVKDKKKNLIINLVNFSKKTEIVGKLIEEKSMGREGV